MDAQAVLSLQYETQHFGFHPRVVLDLVYNVFYENVVMVLNDLKDYMIQKFSKIQPPHVIQAQIDSILRNIVRALDKSIDKLEVFSTLNVFSIPEYVVLPEDLVHLKSPCSKDEAEKIDKEIEELKQKILEEKAKRYSLLRKVHEQKQIKEYLLCHQNELTTLMNKASQEGVNEESIETLYENLCKLLSKDALQPESDLISSLQ